MVARFEELAKYKLAESSDSSWKKEDGEVQKSGFGSDQASVNIQMDVAKTLASWHSISSGVDKREFPLEFDEGVHEDESHSDTASSPRTSSSTGVSSDAHSNPGSNASDHNEHDSTPHPVAQPQERAKNSPARSPPTSLVVPPSLPNSIETSNAMKNFTYLPPIKVETKEYAPQSAEPSGSSLDALKSPAIKHISVKTDQSTICTGARFSSFAEFETAFEMWKTIYHHPFRVASSETLRQPDGSTYEVFRYRYIVYHCAHYGAPRMRGVGKRPNQNYLPCGCKAMLRLNFNYSENALRITTLNDVHTGHEVTAENYARISAKVRKISPNSMDSEEHSPRSSRGSNASTKSHPSPAQTSQKPSPSDSTFYSPKISSPSTHQPSLPVETRVNLTASTLPPNPLPISSNGAFAPPTTQANIVSLLATITQQQQRERAAATAAFLAAHKENLLLAARNSGSGAMPSANPLTLLQGILNPSGLATPISILSNPGPMANTNQPASNDSTSIFPNLASSTANLSGLLNQSYGSRSMNISDYLQALKGASNQLQTAQNLPLVREEPTPIDLSHASPMGAIGVASKSGPTQSQMLDAEKILSAVGEHLSRCTGVEMDERLRQLLTLLHSWGAYSLNQANSNIR